MNIKTRLTRMAAEQTARQLIAAAAMPDLAKALAAVLHKVDVQVYDDPWEMASYVIDDEYLVSEHKTAAADAVQQAVDAQPERIVELDRATGKVIQAFDNFKQLAVDAGVDVDNYAPATVCRALNAMAAQDLSIDVLYACPAVVDEVALMIAKYTGDVELYDSTHDFLRSVNVSEDAAYVIVITDDNAYYGCADVDQLVDTVTALAGEHLLDLLAELR